MVEIDDLPSRSLGASRNLREKPSSRKNIREINCAICHKFTKNNFYDKHRIAVDSQAKNFLKMSENWLDDAYNYILDCTDAHRMYDKDLYYHSTCMINYVEKQKALSNSDKVKDFPHISREALEKVIASLTPSLLNGHLFRFTRG